MAALLSDPRLGALIERAAEARVQQMLGQPKAAPATATTEFGHLAKAFEEMLQLQAMQMPGYFKPLPAEEVQRRAAGTVEMMAILQEAKASGTPPQYYVGEGKFYAGSILYQPGEPLATYLPPPEDFVPCYDGPNGSRGGPLAQRILDAQLVWLGGHSPDIATRVKEAEENAHNLGMPLVGAEPTVAAAPVERLDIAPKEQLQRTPFPNVETSGPGIQGMHVPPATGPRTAQNSQPARGPAYVE